MSLEPIRLNDYDQPDRAKVQLDVSKAVQANPEVFIARYIADPRSFEGRYVAADLFKETFDQFSESKYARNRYNGPVHNSAAVLSAELFRRNLADKTHPERDTVVFLTGSPGAGKTSSVIERNSFPEGTAMVFEGQLSNPKTSIEKIQQVIDAGLRASVVVVHTKPEVALENTLHRFEDYGRGASINVMSQIQGELPDSLRQVQARFGNAVDFNVVDRREFLKPQTLQGWEHLPVLESEGNREQIKTRLSSTLEQLKDSGRIGDAAYRQAAGSPPLEKHEGLAGWREPGLDTHVHRRGLPQGSQQEAVLDRPGQQSIGESRAQAFLHAPRDEALKRHPELKPVLDAYKAAEDKFRASNPNASIAASHAVMHGFREQVATKLRSGNLVNATERDAEQHAPKATGLDR